jgi:NAD(P)-dependent dehydrogenase (short-subunit alcohol dehydrogenase family)
VEIDLSDVGSVTRAAAEILEPTPVVNVLVNNASIVRRHAILAAN